MAKLSKSTKWEIESCSVRVGFKHLIFYDRLCVFLQLKKWLRQVFVLLSGPICQCHSGSELQVLLMESTGKEEVDVPFSHPVLRVLSESELGPRFLHMVGETNHLVSLED